MNTATKTATTIATTAASETATAATATTAAATETAQLAQVAHSAGLSPRRTCSPWARISFLTMVPTCGLLLVGAPPAAAHDTLIGSTPQEGEVLEESPEEIVLEFSGDGLTTGDTITNAIVVRDAEGENWEGDTEVEGSTMSAELPESLPNGEYEILYRVVYSDGHDEELSFGFEVDGPDDAGAADTEDETASDEGTDPVESAEAESGAEDEAGSASESEADEAGGDSTEDAETTDTTSDESANPVPAWLVVAVAVVAVAGGAALIVARRRRR